MASDVYRALLINSMITDIYALKETCTHDMIVRAGCTQIGFHSGCNKRRSGFSHVWVTYLKISIRLGPHGPWAMEGEILKFQFMQTSGTLYLYTSDYREK
jgi:hypothetical protein